MKTKRMIRMSLVLASVLLSCLSVLAMAEDAPKPAAAKATPWKPEDILSAEYAFQWKISPDGKWAVWVKMQMDKEKNGRTSNLFLTNLETKKEVQLTRGTETHGRPDWSPNGEFISFTSTRPLPSQTRTSRAPSSGS
jgi:dipeptidyl aminopeptidase/acylaminoacyl peptidase